jgi:hypothetical protein
MALADDHASRMLTQMAWKVLQAIGEFQELSHPAVVKIDAGGAEAFLQRVLRPT